jgi:hypothetical protein
MTGQLSPRTLRTSGGSYGHGRLAGNGTPEWSSHHRGGFIEGALRIPRVWSLPSHNFSTPLQSSTTTGCIGSNRTIGLNVFCGCCVTEHATFRFPKALAVTDAAGSASGILFECPSNQSGAKVRPEGEWLSTLLSRAGHSRRSSLEPRNSPSAGSSSTTPSGSVIRRPRATP